MSTYTYMSIVKEKKKNSFIQAINSEIKDEMNLFLWE